MNKDWNRNEWQGRSQKQVESAISTIAISIIAIVVTITTILI